MLGIIAYHSERICYRGIFSKDLVSKIVFVGGMVLA
jgi:hypothetical protein